MMEFGASNYQKLTDFDGFKKSLGSKPLMVFNGTQWEADQQYNKIQNFFIDFFRGHRPGKIALKGIDHVISFNIVDGVINFRAYSITLTKSGTKTPNTILKPMGPFMDLTLRRSQFASEDLWKTACKKPKQ